MQQWIDIAVQTPAHSHIGGLLTYRHVPEAENAPLTLGTLVRVPLGSRDLLGVVWAIHNSAPEALKEASLRDVAGVLQGLPPLSAHWRQLVQFAAHYYQRSVGEVAMAALPPQLRDLNTVQLARRLKKQAAKSVADTDADTKAEADATPKAEATGFAPGLPLSAQQTQVLAEIAAQAGPFLIFGATGSG